MATTTAKQTKWTPKVRKGIVRRFLQIAISLLLQGLVLLGAAGRLDWTMAWVFLGLNVSFAAINAWVLLRKDPELIAERGQIKEDAKTWDRPLAGIVSLFGPLGILLIAGLDQRSTWSPPLALWIPLVALAVTMLGYALWGWAMASNRFFAGLVRIQKERGHTVATAGPYQLVRHPGYAGLIVWTLTTPLVLSSLWALIPAVLTVVTAIVRTALEDHTLQEELAGYTDYAQQVRYRLLPGIW